MINPVLVAALIAAQTTPAAQRCLTRQEAGDIALTAVSIGLGALVERCRPHVGPTAFLNADGRRGAETMLARLRAAAEPRRSSAFAAFARMAAPDPSNSDDDEDASDEATPVGSSETESTPDVPGEDEETAMPALDPASNPELMSGFVLVMAAAAISSIDTAACSDANALVEALSPLPPENIARIAGAGLGIAGTMRPGSADNPLCPA